MTDFFATASAAEPVMANEDRIYDKRSGGSFHSSYFATRLYGLTSWTPTLIADTDIKGGFAVGCPSAILDIVDVAAMIALGHSDDTHGERRWHVSLPAGVGAVGLAGTALATHNTVASLVFLALAAAGILSYAPLFWSLTTTFLQNRRAAASLVGINLVGNLAGIVSPVLVGYMKEVTRDNRTGIFVLVALLAAGALAVLRLP